MTKEQIILDKFLETVLAIIGGGKDGRKYFISAQIAQMLKQYPHASEVKTTIKNGEVYIVDADERISNLIGYTPDELRGKPLTYIMGERMDEVKQNEILNNLRQWGVSVKTNTNKRKDGSTVDTWGMIFKIGENDYREVVMDASKIVGYEMVGR